MNFYIAILTLYRKKVRIASLYHAIMRKNPNCEIKNRNDVFISYSVAETGFHNWLTFTVLRKVCMLLALVAWPLPHIINWLYGHILGTFLGS